MNFATSYWMIVGVALVVAGVLSAIMGLTGGTVHVGPVSITGAHSLWRGAVVLATGAFLVTASSGGITDREDEALVFMGSVMIWIVGGTELLTILLGAIPGEPDVWIASGSAFVAAVGPPYSPSVLAILVTLPAFGYAEEDFRTLLKRLFGGNGE
ncbi:hypothetical protein [Halodesulfurarchaeum sp.]|uniref:hypothetical protein n=1 Tax=Halodesulfurarchaeum sp. TaxID=1980530 RepID=UPI002FC3313B